MNFTSVQTLGTVLVPFRHPQVVGDGEEVDRPTWVTTPKPWDRSDLDFISHDKPWVDSSVMEDVQPVS